MSRHTEQLKIDNHSIRGAWLSSNAKPPTIKHDEDKLEELFWEFDDKSQHCDRRLVFKEMLRGYAAHLAKQR